MRKLLVTSLMAGVLVLAAPAPAFAEPAADDRAVARALFDQGRVLMKDGNYAEACPKLEESQRLETGVGTLFNLADCYEHLGRTASAWAGFAEAADLAKRSGQEDREQVARDRATALAPKLSKMRVHMAAPLPSMLEIRYDDKPFSVAILDTDTPVDPGDHRLKATAPGKVSSETTVHIDAGAAVAQIEIPMLADAPAPPPPPPAIGPKQPDDLAPPQENGSSWQKPATIAAGAGAIVALGIGAIFGLKASSNWSDAQKTCANQKCDAAGFSKWDDARSAGNVSTVGFIAGGVLAAAAIVLFVTSPSSEKNATPPATARAGGPPSLWRMP
jgi:hypothetical protein